MNTRIPVCRCLRRAGISQSTTGVGHRVPADDVEHTSVEWCAAAAARCMQLLIVFLLLSTDVHFTQSFLVPAEPREYCQWENFNASCPSPDEVVLMQSARYGRIRFGRCMREDHGSVGCSADVLPQLDRKCSGRRACHMPIPDATLHGIHPCPKELMPYLEASYQCVKIQGAVVPGHSSTPSRCDPATGYQIYVEHGYLAGLTIVEWPRVGTPECPWVLRAAPGRRFNLSLYSFFSPPSHSGTPVANPTTMGRSSTGSVQSGTGSEDVPASSGCSLSNGGLIVFDGNRSTALPVCVPPSSSATTPSTDGHREHLIYTSEGPTIRLFLQTFAEIGAPSKVAIGTVVRGSGGTATAASGSQSSPVYTTTASSSFLIRFQAFGCADITGLTNAVVRRYGDSVSVRCLATGETYFLTCIESRWVGELNNCTSSRGILLVIGLGVAVGVAFGVVLLFGLLLCFRSRRNRRCFKSGLACNNQPLLMSLNGPGNANCSSDGRLDTAADERLIDLVGPSGSSPCCGTEVTGRDENESERYFVNRHPWHSTYRNPRVSFDTTSVTAAPDVSLDSIESGRRRLCPFHQLMQLSSTSLTTTSLLPAAFKHPAGTYVTITSGRGSDDACGSLERQTAANCVVNENVAEHLSLTREGQRAGLCFLWSDRDEGADDTEDQDNNSSGDEEDKGASVEQTDDVETDFGGSATLDLIRSSSSVVTAVTLASSSTASAIGCVETSSGLPPAAILVADSRRYLSGLGVGVPRRPTVSWNDSVVEKSIAAVTGSQIKVATSDDQLHDRSLNAKRLQ